MPAAALLTPLHLLPIVPGAASSIPLHLQHSRQRLAGLPLKPPFAQRDPENLTARPNDHILALLAPVAQWNRAPVFGTGCRGFESLQVYTVYRLTLPAGLLVPQRAVPRLRHGACHGTAVPNMVSLSM